MDSLSGIYSGMHFNYYEKENYQLVILEWWSKLSRLFILLCDDRLLAVPVPWLTHIPIPVIRKQMNCCCGSHCSPSFSRKDDQLLTKAPVVIPSLPSPEWGGNTGNVTVKISSWVRLKGDALCVLQGHASQGDDWVKGPYWKTHWAGWTGHRGVGL